MRLVNGLIATGMKVTAAVNEAAEQYELSSRTIWSARRATYMVAAPDVPVALAPQWSGPRGMQAECHPEALRMYLDLAAAGARLSQCYQRIIAVAAENNWAPIPSSRTLRRLVARRRELATVH
ncbi:MAG: hypothetical protein Q4G26_15485 [Paracoccus sp. (in: a-proteobacteria)]|nr:hypothetical protein [Paracoccus sp. (in: a-proteobacteria)]